MAKYKFGDEVLVSSLTDEGWVQAKVTEYLPARQPPYLRGEYVIMYIRPGSKIFGKRKPFLKQE